MATLPKGLERLHSVEAVRRRPLRIGRMKTSSELDDLVLPASDGTEVRLGDLWTDRTVVVVWLRHYG